MNLKFHLPIVFLLFIFCFLLYYSTLCPTVSWSHFSENGPRLLTQIYTEPLTLSQKHLPYLAVAKTFLFLVSTMNQIANRFMVAVNRTSFWFTASFQLLVSDPALPINLLSVLFSSLTVVVAYFVIFLLSPVLKLPSHITKPNRLIWLPSALGSLVLALSPTFWSQAVATQTASFNLFLFSFILLSFLKLRKSSKKKARKPLFCFLVSASLLLFNNMPLDLSLNFRTPKQFGTNLGTIVDLILTNFKGTGLILFFIGFFFGLEQKLLLFLFASILLGQSFLDSVFSTSTTPPFFLPSFLVIALFSGLGIKILLEIILAISFSDLAVSFENRFFLLIFRLKKAGKFLRYVVFCLLGYSVLTATLASIKGVYPLVSLKNERGALNFGQNSIAVLPENSLVFCEADKLLYTLEYFQKVVKPGKKFELLLFAKDTKEMVEENIPIRPVFFALVRSPIPVGETKGIWEGYALVSRGPLYQVQKSTFFQ